MSIATTPPGAESHRHAKTGRYRRTNGRLFRYVRVLVASDADANNGEPQLHHRRKGDVIGRRRNLVDGGSADYTQKGPRLPEVRKLSLVEKKAVGMARGK